MEESSWPIRSATDDLELVENLEEAPVLLPLLERLVDIVTPLSAAKGLVHFSRPNKKVTAIPIRAAAISVVPSFPSVDGSGNREVLTLNTEANATMKE